MQGLLKGLKNKKAPRINALDNDSEKKLFYKILWVIF